MAIAITSAKVGMPNCPSKRALSVRSAGSRSRARNVRISASVKSSANQPWTSSAVDALARAAIGEFRMLRDIGRAADLVLVPADQHAVARDDEIGFDRIGALFDRECIAFERVFGAIRAGAAVGDDERTFDGHATTRRWG